MISTIIQLKNEINEQHYHDKGKPVYINIDGTLRQIDRVDEYDECVLIVANGDVQIIENIDPERAGDE